MNPESPDLKQTVNLPRTYIEATCRRSRLRNGDPRVRLPESEGTGAGNAHRDESPAGVSLTDAECEGWRCEQPRSKQIWPVIFN